MRSFAAEHLLLDVTTRSRIASRCLTDLDLMRLHVEAEFTHDAAGHLVSRNEPAAAPAPRFFLGQTALGMIRRYRRDVSEARRRMLEAALSVAAKDPFVAVTDRPLDPVPFEHILSRSARPTYLGGSRVPLPARLAAGARYTDPA